MGISGGQVSVRFLPRFLMQGIMDSTKRVGDRVMFELLGWIGSITGPMGALLLALNIRVSRFGYVLFLVSSLTMTVYAIDGGQPSSCTEHIV